MGAAGQRIMTAMVVRSILLFVGGGCENRWRVAGMAGRSREQRGWLWSRTQIAQGLWVLRHGAAGRPFRSGLGRLRCVFVLQFRSPGAWLDGFRSPTGGMSSVPRLHGRGMRDHVRLAATDCCGAPDLIATASWMSEFTPQAGDTACA